MGTYIQKTLYVHFLKIYVIYTLSQKIIGRLKMKMHKICPRCGSRNVDWIIPQNWSQCVCKDCDYTGPIIEGNDELAEEIREAYVESLKNDDE